MARGRLLNRTVCASLKFHLLSNDTCRLLATWTIAHLDMNGVFYGSATMVKSHVFPRRVDVSLEDIEGYIQEMIALDLIYRFEANGDVWQCWPGFAENQPNLRRDRERPEYPLPPGIDGKMTADYRHDDGKDPAEEKLREVKRRETAAAVFPPTSRQIEPSNGQGQEPEPEEKSILSFSDPLSMVLEVKRRNQDKKSWTVTGPEGANPYEGPPLEAFCTLIRLPEVPPPKKVTAWGRKLQQIAEQWDADPETVTKAINAIPESDDHGWRSFASPYSPSFSDALGVMIARVRNGGPDPPSEPAILETDLTASPEWMTG